MNFFDAQDQARRATRRLVVAYIVATAIIVAGVTALAGFALFAMSAEVANVRSPYFLEDYGPFLFGVAALYGLFNVRT